MVEVSLIEKLTRMKASWPSDSPYCTAIDDAICLIERHAPTADSAVCPYVVTSDEGTSYCRLAQENGGPPTQRSEDTAWSKETTLDDCSVRKHATATQQARDRLLMAERQLVRLLHLMPDKKLWDEVAEALDWLRKASANLTSCEIPAEPKTFVACIAGKDITLPVPETETLTDEDGHTYTRLKDGAVCVAHGNLYEMRDGHWCPKPPHDGDDTSLAEQGIIPPEPPDEKWFRCLIANTLSPLMSGPGFEMAIGALLNQLRPYLRQPVPVAGFEEWAATEEGRLAIDSRYPRESARLVWEAARQPKPVTVDLEECAGAVRCVDVGTKSHDYLAESRLIAKAVLDAAGVKYVE